MKKRGKKKRPSVQMIYGKRRGDILEKCVMKVKKNSRKYGKKVNPWAICQSIHHFKKRGKRK